MPRVAEVIEASTTEFVAECYELYSLPPLGSLMRTGDGQAGLYGIVCSATTLSVEPGRRPIARGKEEPSEEAVYRSNPQLTKLLRSEFTSLVVGHLRDGKVLQRLPPAPARIHGFVHLCEDDEVREFSRSFEFLPLLLHTRPDLNAEEVTAAALRNMARAHEDPRRFLVRAGKELAVALGGDFGKLRAVLVRLGGDVRDRV